MHSDEGDFYIYIYEVRLHLVQGFLLSNWWQTIIRLPKRLSIHPFSQKKKLIERKEWHSTCNPHVTCVWHSVLSSKGETDTRSAAYVCVYMYFFGLGLLLFVGLRTTSRGAGPAFSLNGWMRHVCRNDKIYYSPLSHIPLVFLLKNNNTQLWPT